MSANNIIFNFQANAQPLIGATNQSAQALQRMQQAATQGGAGLNRFGQSTGQAAQATNQVTQSASRAGQGLSQMGQSGEQAATSSQRVGTAIKEAGAFIAATAGGVVSLISEFTGLERAQFQVQRAQDAYNRSLTSIQAAQNNVNKLIAQGKTDTPQYALAVQRLSDAQDKSKTAEERLQLTQVNLNERMAEFAANIIPDVIQVVTGAIAAYESMSKAMKEVAVTQEGVNAAMAATEGVTAATGAELGGLTAAEGASAAAAADLGTNVNNVTTAISGVTDSVTLSEKAYKGLSGTTAAAAASLTEFGGAETIAATQAESAAVAMTGEGAAASRDAIAFNQAVAGASRKAEASAVASASAVRNAAAMEGEAVAARAAGTASNATGGILGGLGGKLGAIGAIIAVIGGALLAFAHNMFGMRDGINAVGVAIGNAVPGLKGFLTQLQGAGNFITKILGGDVPKAAEKGGESIQKMGDDTKKASDEMQKALEDMDKSVNKLADTISEKLGKGLAEGPKAFRKAVQDLNKEIGFNLPKAAIIPLTVAADTSNIKKEAESAAGVFMAALRGGASLSEMQSIGAEWISRLQAGMAGKTPAIQAQMQKVIDDINTILSTTATGAEQAAALGSLEKDINAIGDLQGVLNDKLKAGQNLWGENENAASDAAGAIGDAQEAAAGYGQTVGFIGGLPFLPISEQEIVQPWNAGNTAAQTYKSGIERANQASKDFGTQVGEALGKGIAALQKHVQTWQQTFANMWEKAKAPGGWVDSVANAFADEYQKAKPHIDAIQTAMGNVWEQALTVVDRTLPQIAQRVQGFSENPAIKNFGAGILDALNRIGAAVGPTITDLLQRFADALSTFDPVAAFDATIKFFQDLPGKIAGFLQQIPAALQGVGIGILNALIQNLANVGAIFYQLIVPPLLAIPGQLGELGTQILNAFVQGLQNFANVVSQYIVQPILSVPGQLGALGSQILNSFVQGLQNFGNVIRQFIIAPILQVPGQIGNLGTQIAGVLAQGLQNFRNVINQFIIQPILQSPQLMTGIGTRLVGVIAQGLQNFTNVVQQFLINPIVQLPSKIGNIGTQIIGQISQGFQNFANVVQQFIVKPILDIPSKLATIGGDILKAIGNIFQPAKAAGGAGPGGFSNFMDPAVIKSIIDSVIAEFNRLQPAIAPIMQGVTSTFTAFMNQLPAIAFASGIDPTMVAFQSLPAKVATSFAQVTTVWQQIMGTMPGIALANGIDPTAAAFAGLAAAVAPAFGSIGTLAQQIFNGLAGIAAASIGGIAAAFTRLPSAVAPAFGAIGTVAQVVFRSIATIAASVIPSISNAFRSMATAAGTQFNGIRTAAASTFTAVASAASSAASRVSSSMNAIAQSASRAIGVVNQLRNAINSLQNKTVTITVVTVYRTVFAAKGGTFASPPTGKAGFSGVVNQATRFGNVVAGEAGPELVSVLPLKGSNTNTINLGDKAKKDFAGTRNADRAGGKQGLSVKGQVTNAQPIILTINGRVVAQMIQQQLLEFSDANQ